MKDLSDSRVLIVDDVRANVELLAATLRGDYKLSVAVDGPTALRSIEENPPDLVLLDIIMPGMDGYEVCRRLRANAQTIEIPVMFLTALDEMHSKTNGFEVGGNDYLTKPFDVLEVKARVRSLLRAKAYTDAVKQKIARELKFAREIQMGLLPTDLAECTADAPLDVAALLIPAREVGGDLYDVLRLPGDRIAVVVGDVSGKGVPSAIFMAVALTLVRTFCRLLQRPEEILARVNDELVAQNARGMFVTLACAIFDLPAGKVTCANAGHHAPVLLRTGEAPRLVLPATGTISGMFTGSRIGSETLKLRPGDRFVFYTDGVTEAFDGGADQFGESRLLEQLRDDPGSTASECAASLLSSVRRHAGEAAQSDDITIVVAQYDP